MMRFRTPRFWGRRWRRVLFSLPCNFSILLTHNSRLLWLRAFGPGKLFVERRNSFKARRALVCNGPLSEENVDLLSHFCIDHIISG